MLYHGIHRHSSTIIRSLGLDYCVMPSGATVAFKAWADASKSENVAANVQMRSTPVLHRNSLIPVTHGMEGAVTGSVSGKPVHGPATPAADAKTVKTYGGELIRHEQLWELNAKNSVGLACHDDAIILDVDVHRPNALFDSGRPNDNTIDKYAKNEGICDKKNVDFDTQGKVQGGPDGTLLDGKSDIRLRIHGSDLDALGPEKLALFLRNSGFKGGSITMISCNAAKEGRAPELDKELEKLGIKAEIIAYDAYVGINKDGRVFCARGVAAMPWGGFAQDPWFGLTTFPKPEDVAHRY